MEVEPTPTPCRVDGPVQQGQEKITRLVALSSVIASIGGILLGYDMGIASNAILQIRVEYQLGCLPQEIVVSSVVFGAFVGSLLAGSFVDRFGRRFSILGTSLLFIGGSIFLALSQNMAMLIVGRLVVGFGVALSTAAECTYISEISPKRWRGMLVSLNELGITFGFLLAFVVGHLFISQHDGWRYMLGLAAVPAFVQLVGVILLPPSPYYLILRGNPIKAEEIIKKIHPGRDSQQVVEEITSTVLEAKCSGMRQLFSQKDNMRNRMIIGILLALLQQLSGNTNVLYFAPIIFQQFGFCTELDSTLQSIYLGVVKVVTAVLALALIDRVGRRVLLCSGAFIMGLSMAILGIVTVVSHAAPPADKCSRYYTEPNVTDIPPPLVTIPVAGGGYLVGVDPVTTPHSPVYSVEDDSKDKCKVADTPSWIRVTSIVTLMIYIGAYQFSFGIGTWLVLSEIFPTKVRGRCIGISTSATWGISVVLSATFLETIDAMGIGYTMIMYSIFSFMSFLFIFFILPETKQKSLEEISANFNQGMLCQVDCMSGNGMRKFINNGNGHVEARRRETGSRGTETFSLETSANHQPEPQHPPASRTNHVMYRRMDSD